MAYSKFARRRFVAGTVVASAALVAAPFVRGAHAAGKLSVGLWDHWVPNANDATETAHQGVGREGEGRGRVDFITTQANKLLLTGAAEAQAKTGHDILAFTLLAAGALRRAARRRSNDLMDELIKTNGKVNATVEYLGKVGRQVARGPGDGRQPDQGAVLAHRPHEEACRHRRAGDVSGRRAAQGRRLDARYASSRLPRPATRAATRSASASARPATASTPTGAIFHALRGHAGQRQGRHHGEDRRGAPGARLLQAADGASCRPTRRRGTMPRTTSS